MKTYVVNLLDLFKKRFSKIVPKNKQEDLLNRLKKLSLNPYTGKPLGYEFLRELKLDKFRVYYMIYENELVVMVITVGDKKDQEETIIFLKNNMKNFKEFLTKK